MCQHKHICIVVADKLLLAKKMISERLPKALKENNYVQVNFIADEVVNKVFNEVFMKED